MRFSDRPHKLTPGSTHCCDWKCPSSESPIKGEKKSPCGWGEKRLFPFLGFDFFFVPKSRRKGFLLEKKKEWMSTHFYNNEIIFFNY